MKTRVERQSDAFKEALELCYLYGLNWREHIIPKTFKNTTVGYYILDETKSTVIETINF